MKKKQTNSTSWGKVGKWYHKLVGEEGMYYHKNIILPNVIPLLFNDIPPSPSLLDIGCGQGILSRHIPESIEYHGVDISQSLIREAKVHKKHSNHHFYTADATKNIPVDKKDFTHATIILALQNMESPEQVLKNLSKHLAPGGKLLIVLNHPCFRIPRQSHWGTDDKKKLQYRRIDQYMSSLKIPIQAKPSKKEQSAVTWSFHHPLTSYFTWLSESKFKITHLTEWCSDKTSQGGKAKIENRARKEFPLFMCLVAEKS